MSGPDFAGVLDAHRRTSDAYSPLCACGRWRDKRDDGTRHRAHVAAALNAELVRWLAESPIAALADEWERQAAEYHNEHLAPSARSLRRRAVELRATLAALTGSDQ